MKETTITPRRRRPAKRTSGLGLAAKVLLGAAVGLTGTAATAAAVAAMLHGTDSIPAVSTPAGENTSAVTSAVTSKRSATSDDGTADQGRRTPSATAAASAAPTSGRANRSGRHRAEDNGVDTAGRDGSDN